MQCPSWMIESSGPCHDGASCACCIRRGLPVTLRLPASFARYKMQRHIHQAPALGDYACCEQPRLPTKFVKSSPAQPQARATWSARTACCGNNASRTWCSVCSAVCNNLTIFHQESNHLQRSPSQPVQDLQQALSATPSLYLLIGSTKWRGKMRSQALLRTEDTLKCPRGRILTSPGKSGMLCMRTVRDGFLHFISQIIPNPCFIGIRCIRRGSAARKRSAAKGHHKCLCREYRGVKLHHKQEFEGRCLVGCRWSQALARMEGSTLRQAEPAS